MLRFRHVTSISFWREEAGQHFSVSENSEMLTR
jgi:hypothetical protein